MSKNLTFKLVMEADTKGFVGNVKQSEKTLNEAFKAIESGNAKFVADAKSTNEAMKEIVPSEVEKKVAQLVSEFHSAGKALGSLSGDANVSAENLKQLGDYGEKALQGLKDDLQDAKLHLNMLAATKATPEDIAKAQQEVKELETGVKQVTIAFNGLKGQTQPVLQSIEQSAKDVQGAVVDIVPSETQQRVAQLVSELNSATKTLDSMGDEAQVSADNLKQLGAYGEKALQGLQNDLKQAKLHLNYLAATNATPADIENAQREVKELETGVKQVKTAFDAYSGAASSAISAVDNVGDQSAETAQQVKQLDKELETTNQELNQTEQASKGVSGELQGLKTGFNALTGALAALGIGVTASEIAQTADAYKNLSGRISIAIGEHGNLEKAMDDVKNVAIATNSNLEATGELYARLTKIGQEMKWPQEQALALTETINKAIQVGGGSAASNEAAITQLNQALGSGVLRGDEFNSMMEQSPRLAQALADGLGVTTGKLRELAGEGKLTTEVVTQALLSQSEKITAEFDKFPATIGASIENLKTAWTIYIGEADAASGMSAKVAESIKFVAENLDVLIGTLTAAAQAYMAYKSIGIAMTLLDKANAARAAQVAISSETAALTANVNANIANARATQLTAAAKTGLAAATNASTVANTAAAGGFSRVTTAANGLKTGLVSVLSRFGAYGVAAAGIVMAGDLIIDNLKKVDEWLLKQGSNFIDWTVSRIKGTKSLLEQEREWIAEEEASRKKQEQLTEAKKKHEAQTESLRLASLGLNETSRAAVDEFDKQVEAGKRLSDALKGVAESFNFDSTTSINNGLTALLALEAQGKATSVQIRSAFSEMIKDQDLAELQGKLAAIPVNIEKQLEAANAKVKAKQIELDNWKKANQDMAYDDWIEHVKKYRDDIAALQAEAVTLQTQYTNAIKSNALVQGAILDEAIRRTGLSYEELSGKSTKAFTSARNDVNVLINNFDELKEKGVDVGHALDLSISKAINTATNQKELDELKVKINSLRHVLGEEVADGLLNQAEKQLISIKERSDEAKSGINSVQEAFNLFGIKTPEQMKVVAEEYQKAYEVMRDSGKATLAQKQEAFKQYAEKAIAANKGVVDSTISSQASMLDLKIEVDSTGKASVKAMDNLTKANERVKDSAHRIGDGYREAGQIAREEANAAQIAWNKASQEAAQKWDAEMKRQSKGLSAAISGYESYSKNDVIAQIKSMGYSDSEAEKLAGSIWSQAMATDRDAKFAAYGKGGNIAMNKLIEQEFNNAAAKGLTTQHGTNKINELLRDLDVKSTGSTKVNDYAPSISEPKVRDLQNDTSTKNVRFEFVSGGKHCEMQGSQEDGDTMESILRELELLKKAM